MSPNSNDSNIEMNRSQLEMQWTPSRHDQAVNAQLLNLSPFDFNSPRQRAQKRANMPHDSPTPGPQPSLAFFSHKEIGGPNLNTPSTAASRAADRTMDSGPVFNERKIAQTAAQRLSEYVTLNANATTPNRILFPDLHAGGPNPKDLQHGHGVSPKNIQQGPMPIPSLMNSVNSLANVGGLLGGSNGSNNASFDSLNRPAANQDGAPGLKLQGYSNDNSSKSLLEKMRTVSLLPPSPEYVTNEPVKVVASPGYPFVHVLIVGDEIQFLPALIIQGQDGGVEAMQRVLRAVYKTLSAQPQFECYLLDDQLEIRVVLLIDWTRISMNQRIIYEDFLIGFAMGFISDGNPKHRYCIQNFGPEETDAYVKASLQRNARDSHCLAIIAAGSYWLPYEESLESIMTFLRSDDQTESSRPPRLLNVVLDHPFTVNVVKDCKTGAVIFHKSQWTDVFRTQFRQVGPPKSLASAAANMDLATTRIIADRLKAISPSPCYDHYILGYCKNCSQSKCRFGSEMRFNEAERFALWFLYSTCDCAAGALCRDMDCPKRHRK